MELLKKIHKGVVTFVNGDIVEVTYELGNKQVNTQTYKQSDFVRPLEMGEFVEAIVSLITWDGATDETINPEKVVSVSSTYSSLKYDKITQDQLQNFIDSLNDDEDENYGYHWLMDHIDWDKDHFIQFDLENTEDGKMGYMGCRLTGLQTIGDFTFLGVTSGGDWETPIFFLIYMRDGKLRGYVPADGQYYNHAEKIAFGYCSNDDSECHRVYGCGVDELGNMDNGKLKASIIKDFNIKL